MAAGPGPSRSPARGRGARAVKRHSSTGGRPADLVATRGLSCDPR